MKESRSHWRIIQAKDRMFLSAIANMRKHSSDIKVKFTQQLYTKDYTFKILLNFVY